MKRKLLIIGYGSAGRRFANIAKKNFKNLDINIFTKQKKIGFKIIERIEDIKKFNPNYIIISSPTKFHFHHLLIVNKFLKGKRILIEKPLYSELKNLRNLKNKVFVGYNLRNLKIIQFLKSVIFQNKTKIYDINFINHSYLPSWRKNVTYQKSSSAKKKYGGGVILDCSHEIDLARWMIGKIDILSVQSSKKSKLKIETEDNCKIIGKHKNINISIDLNYYSINKKRKICLLGDNLKIIVDLVSFKILIFKKEKKIIKKFNKNEFKNSYFLELQDLLSNKEKNLTNYKSALITQKFIQNIQDFKHL
jgi:predicted dehydrogenase